MSLFVLLNYRKLNSVVNKKLAIDLDAPRQLVWERDGDRTQILDSGRADYPQWIDAPTTVAEPLAKAMAGDRMMVTLDTGVVGVQPNTGSRSLIHV